MAFFENLSKFYKKQNRTSNVFHGTSLDFPEIDMMSFKSIIYLWRKSNNYSITSFIGLKFD